MNDWLHRWTIVPEAHLRIHDLPLQIEMYDLFHLHWVSRLGHALGAPAALIGAGALLDSLAASALPVTSATSFGGAAVLFAAQAAYGLRLGPAVLLVMLLPLYALSTASNLLMLSAGPWAGIALVFGGALLQTLSHAAEPIPPPWSRSKTWKPFRTVWRESRPLDRVALLALSVPALFLELWAAFRILPLQAFLAMVSLGYRPELRRAIRARRAQILADSTRGWGRRDLPRIRF